MLSYFSNLNFVLQALIACLFTYSITILGASIVLLVKKLNKNFLDAMLGIAGGIMISASFFSLIEPAINMSLELKLHTWLVLGIGITCGSLLLFFSDIFINKFLNKKKKKKKSKFKRCLMLIFSITIHNIPEGMAIGVAFGSLAYGIKGATLTSAMMLALGIGIQNFPEGSAVSIPLRREGLSRWQAFFFGQLTGIVEPISGVIGALLVIKIRFLLPYFLAFAAGAMIYVVISEIIPESQQNKNKNLISLLTLLGFTIMMILDIAFC